MGVGLRWCTESEYRKDMYTGAFDENNGYNNFNSILGTLRFITKSGFKITKK